mmetsp:Transcript_1108/g.2602  ORF Transcript_1108/g.2602 Transcript_1108/m.2602 type:complete len:195 (+) Transcript_1108:297-881(+)
MERLPKTMRMDIGHGAFQLDESLPREGVDKYGFLSKLIPPEVLDPMIDILCEQFEDLDMEEMNRTGLLGNSALAHRLQIWAETNLTRTRSLALKDELFKIHSIKGRSMGDVDAIIEAAASAGLTDESLVRSVLKDPKYIDRFKKQKKRARETYGIESVPCLVLIEANTGKHRKLDDATGIETVDGFSDLIAKHL